MQQVKSLPRKDKGFCRRRVGCSRLLWYGLMLSMIGSIAAMASEALAAAPSAHSPGVNRVILELVTPESSEQAIHSRALPGDLNGGVSDGQSVRMHAAESRVSSAVVDGIPSGPASISELARALRHDPDLIYEYVHNNIAYYPIWGIQKGALGAILDNRGTAFDQAELMVTLLRESGFAASYIKGRIQLNAAQIGDWLGVDTDSVCAVWQLLSQGQVPISSIFATTNVSCPGGTAGFVSAKLDHLWVKVDIDGTDYVFDPSFKSHTEEPGIDLGAATGYDAATYLDDARSGASIAADAVQHINRAKLRGNLTDYATNLTNYLRANKPAGTLDEVLGGRRIVAHTGGALRQSALPYQDTTAGVTEWSEDIPAHYSPILQIQYAGIDQAYTSAALYGKRLTITYDSTTRPLLKLDGSTVATGNALTPGSLGEVSFTITHGAYGDARANQSLSQQIEAGGTFLIGNGWGPAGRGLVEFHRKRLDEAMAAGGADASESILGSALAVLSSTWIAQANRAYDLSDRLAGTDTLLHHQIGIAGYNTGAYVDLPGNFVSVVSKHDDPDAEQAAFYNAAMHVSILESTAVQQTTANSAVSTVKLIDIAAANGQRIYDARGSNYSAAVEPNLLSCDAFLATFRSAVGNGDRLILPRSCRINEADWTGVGYFRVSGDGKKIRAAINQLAGGFSSTPLSPSETAEQTRTNSITPNEREQSIGSSFGDPIDMSKGHYLYAHEDIGVGAGAFPLSLRFQRLYSSGLRTRSGELGNGWTHNFAATSRTGSDGFQGLGEDSALDAVSTIVELMVSFDLLTDVAEPLDKLVIATLGQRWFGDQLLDNIVIVQQGLNGEVFVKLPDGTYNPPPGNPAKLTANPGGTFSYETLHKARLDFDTAGKLATFIHPSGVEVRLTYSGDRLDQVQNSLGRVLTLTHASGRIAGVADGSRSVGYRYDTDGNLIRFTNADSKDTTFAYDLPGRLTKLFHPTRPSTAFTTNDYDSLGRVKTQANANGQIYSYYFAGSRSEEVGPGNVSRIAYLDALGKILKAIDPLGRVTTTTYDGQTRAIETVLPEGNRIEYVYEDAPCAIQQRCPHHIKTLRQVPKAGTGLPILTNTFVYNDSNNRVAQRTDARGQVTDYTYTPRGNLLTIKSTADDAGVRPSTTYGYATFAAAGFPAFTLQTSETTKISASSSVVTKTTYQAANNFVPLTTVVDAGTGKLNLTTTYTYNAVGDLIEVDGPRTDVSDKTTMDYDAERRLTRVTDALNKRIVTAYNADGRLVRSAAQLGGQWLVTCRSYTPSGKPLKLWGPANSASADSCPAAAAPVPVTLNAYDNLDRLRRVTQYLPADQGGNRVTEIRYTKDNSVRQIRRAVGTPLEQTYAAYTYTANGQVKTVKDAGNNLTTYQYDGHDRPVKIRYPHRDNANTSSTSDYEAFGYDNNGNVTSLRRRNGQQVTLTYDTLDRVLARTYPDAAQSIAFDYDLAGRRIRAGYTDNSDVVDYLWDAADRLTSVTAGGKTITYQYDKADNRTRVTWPEGGFHVTTRYDVLNRPVAIKEQGASTLAAYAYDERSRRTTVTLGNGTTTSYRYSDQAALERLTQDLGGSNRDVTWTYSRNQLQDITGLGWDNDAYGWSGYQQGTERYTANGLNQYSEIAGTAFSYDANGNLTGDGVWTYGYDLDNRLTTANKSGLAATLDYDAVGRLSKTVIGGTTTHLLYDGAEPIAEYNASGTLRRRYVHGPGIDEPLVVYQGSGTGNKQWLYADHLGSVVAKADSAGTATATYTYGPFGEPGESNWFRFRYTGQQYLGGLGLYYYKARIYSPSLGRFLQTDPIGYADDLNLYTYVGNNPVGLVDPSGLIAADAAMLAGKLGSTVSKWWENSVAGFRSESVGDAALRALQGWPVGGPELIGLGAAVGSIKGLISTKSISPTIRALSEANISNNGITVLGRFQAPPGQMNYIQKATTGKYKGSSHFDLGDSWTPVEGKAADLHFLDIIAGRGDKIILSTPKNKIPTGTSLDMEVKYLIDNFGYRWVNQWSMQKK